MATKYYWILLVFYNNYSNLPYVGPFQATKIGIWNYWEPIKSYQIIIQFKIFCLSISFNNADKLIINNTFTYLTFQLKLFVAFWRAKSIIIGWTSIAERWVIYGMVFNCSKLIQYLQWVLVIITIALHSQIIRLLKVKYIIYQKYNL